MSNVAKLRKQAAEFEPMYLLGRAAEIQGESTDAVTYDQHVFVLESQFRATSDRLSELEQATR